MFRNDKLKSLIICFGFCNSSSFVEVILLFASNPKSFCFKFPHWLVFGVNFSLNSLNGIYFPVEYQQLKSRDSSWMRKDKYEEGRRFERSLPLSAFLWWPFKCTMFSTNCDQTNAISSDGTKRRLFHRKRLPSTTTFAKFDIHHSTCCCRPFYFLIHGLALQSGTIIEWQKNKSVEETHSTYRIMLIKMSFSGLSFEWQSNCREEIYTNRKRIGKTHIEG